MKSRAKEAVGIGTVAHNDFVDYTFQSRRTWADNDEQKHAISQALRYHIFKQYPI